MARQTLSVGAMLSYGIIMGLRRFIRSRSGNIAIISALAMPAMVGFCGLAAEQAFWFYRNRDLQGAADIAAYGGVVVLRSGGSTSAVTAAATADAVSNGWRQAGGTIVVQTPPTSGAYQNNLSVAVTLSEQEQRYFSRIYFGNTPMAVSAHATGTYASAGPACFLGLDKTLAGTVDFWGNATADFTACNVISNSLSGTGFKVGGSASVTVPCVQSAGGSSVTTGLHLTQCTSVTNNATPTPDPYSGLPAPTWSGGCSNAPNGATDLGTDGQVTCFNGASMTNIHSSVVFHGTIVVNGGSLTTNASGNISGAGVTIFLTNGATMHFNGGSHLDLTAPTTGTYKGIAIFGDRNGVFATNILNGDNSSSVTGAVYFPSQEVDFLGNFSGHNGCFQLVADVIYYTGNGIFDTNCAGTGVTSIPTPGAIALVE